MTIESTSKENYYSKHSETLESNVHMAESLNWKLCSMITHQQMFNEDSDDDEFLGFE